ncbi:MAG: membrane metalloprotease [Vicingaceae bacterium]
MQKPKLISITNYFLALSLLSFSFMACSDDDDNNSTTASSSTQSVGSFSNGYLSDQTYRSLNVELLYEDGAKPDESVRDTISRFLNQYLNKPQGVSINWKKIPNQGKNVYSLSDLKKIESDFRSVQNSGNVASAYLFFANGDYDQNTQNSTVLGMAYGSTSMVVFHKTVGDNTAGVGSPSTSMVEGIVSRHEFGHIFGLVNLGTRMVNNHQDQAHGKHCDNQDCLMYWETENGSFISNLIGNSVPTLDANCQADLKANGGK